MKLSLAAEEVATFYGKMLEHEYTTKEVFRHNFFRDWRKVRVARRRLSGAASQLGLVPSDACLPRFSPSRWRGWQGHLHSSWLVREAAGSRVLRSCHSLLSLQSLSFLTCMMGTRAPPPGSV